MSQALPFVAVALAIAQVPKSPETTHPESLATLQPPSSIQAVMAHRRELGLDEKQVSQLLDIQKKLDHENAVARNEPPAPMKPKSTGADTSGGGRSHFGHYDGGHRKDSEAVDREEALAQATADNDTRAFLSAEPIFHSGHQWERALDIAEKYRVDYSDKREALKRQAGK